MMPKDQGESIPSLKDFEPITMAVRSEMVLVANPSFSPRSVKEIVALAKARPGKIDYASAGMGQVHHIAMEALMKQVGIDLVHVVYKGGPASLMAVLAEEASICVIGLTPALAHPKSGKQKALAVRGDQRSKLLPEVPTVAEILPGYSIEALWLGFFAPPGTSEIVLGKLNRDINELLHTAEMTEFLASHGMLATGTAAKASPRSSRTIPSVSKRSSMKQTSRSIEPSSIRVKTILQSLR